MRAADVDACAVVFAVSLNESRAARGLAAQPFAGAGDSIQHLLATDPNGAFVAEAAGEVVGFVQAARRERVWVLGKLFVLPAVQGIGVGKGLLDLAIAYGSDLPAGIICSTPDPHALRAYGRLAGFELHPMLNANGGVSHDRIAHAQTVRAGTSADLEFAAEVDRALRLGSHGPDFTYLLQQGCTLFVSDERGYAVGDESGPRIVAGLDDEIAADLLRACLLHCHDGAAVQISRFGAAHQWALHVALDAGLAIAPGGGLVVRSVAVASAAYLPDNVFC
jgi:GNAT superfamily N-acetyltransferase